MSNILRRAAFGCVSLVLLASCASEGPFSESDAVAKTTQALQETPTSCGPSFETNYGEHVVTTAVHNLVLPGITTRPWPKNLLQYRLRLPAGTNLDKVVVRNPSSAIIARQVDLCRTDTNNELIARLTFFADQPAGPADTTYEVAIEPAAAAPPTTSAARTVTASYVELRNADLAVRVPKLGEQTFASVDMQSQAATVAPILSFRLADGVTWVTPSSFEGTKRKLTSLEVFSGATGPLFNEILLAYEFAPTDPSKPAGYWRVSIKVVHDISMVMVEEEYDFGDEEPETQVDQWVMRLSNGWMPTQLTTAWALGHPQLGTSGTVMQAEPNIYTLDSVALTATGIDYPAVSPFIPMNGEQYWSGVKDGAGKFAGIVPLFGGAWRRLPKIAMHAGTTDTTLRFELGITNPKEPSYQLSTAGDDKDLPRSTARRQWGLVLGTPKTNAELFTLRGRYGSLSMNDIKEWQLDWPEIDDLTYDQYPRVVLTPQIAAAARMAYQAGSLPPAVQSALSLFYATSGNDVAQAARNTFNSFLVGTNPGQGYVNDPIMFGSLVSPGSTLPSTFAPMTHYRAGHYVVATLLARAEDYLSWSGADPNERLLMLRQIAMMAQLFNHPEYAPVVSGAHQGNPSMPLGRSAALPLLVALIPNHPMKAQVMDLWFDYYKMMSETYLSTGGSFRESSPNYQNVGLPFIELPLLAFRRLGLSFEPQAMLENATHYQVGTITPIVARYGMRMWEPFGNSGMTPVTSPLITAAIYDAAGPGASATKAQQALKVWDFGGSICTDPMLGGTGCMLTAYAAALGQNNPQTIDTSSKFLPGMGIGLRGRAGTAEESFVMLRGGYNASHMDPAEAGSFSFHSAGDELIGFPDNGYIKGQTAWPLGTAGEPWSTIKGTSSVSKVGEWTDTGFTNLADYAVFNAGLTRLGYGTGAWVRQAMLLKGEQSGEYDYVVFRDTQPFAVDRISRVHIATRLPTTSWQAGASAVLTGRHGGGLRATVLDPSASFSAALGLNYTVQEQPHCRLREAFLGTNNGRPESLTRVATVNTALSTINANPSQWCGQGNGSVSESTIETSGTLNAQSTTWLLQSGLGTPAAPTTTKLADGVFRIVTAVGIDYVFLRDTDFTWQDTAVDPHILFTGRAGVLRIRDSNVALSLNFGTGSISYKGPATGDPIHTLSGEGPLVCRTTLTAPATACNTTPPPAPYTIPTVSGGSSTLLQPGLTYISNGSTRQFRVQSASPITADLLGPDGSRVVINGIVDGAITIDPYKTNFTVLSGTGLFTAGGQTIFGGGPFTVDRRPDRIEGFSEGRPRALWIDGFHVPSTLSVDGVTVTHQEIPTIWLTSVGLTGGSQAFEVNKFDNRLSVAPHPNYTLDRVTGRSIPVTRQPPPGAMVFAGYGSFHDSARWLPHAPVAGDTVFIPSGSGAALLSDTPQLASLIVEGEIMFQSNAARMRATDVEVCGNVTHAANLATSAVSGAWPIDARIQIEATNFKLCSTGRIDVSGKGFQPKLATGGPGYGPSGGAAASAHGAGAGHGGKGGYNINHGLAGGAVHDDVQHPMSPGSAGGTNNWDSYGGPGGGVVRIAATGRAAIDGIINANGSNPYGFTSSVANSGGGSGGAVEISCSELIGAGLVTANGGSVSGTGGGGGGGGRIAVHYASLPAPTASIRFASAGGSTPANSGEAGQPGTVYLTDGRFFPGATVVDSLELVVGSTAPITRPSLTFQDATFYAPTNAALIVDNALTVRGAKSLVKLRSDSWAKSIDVRESARLELVSPATALPGTNGRFGVALRVAGELGVRSGATFAPRSDEVTGVSPQIIAKSVFVESASAIGVSPAYPASAIAADGTGYGGVLAANGRGPGFGLYNTSTGFDGGGGDYGGSGGQPGTTGAGGAPYGSVTAPDQPGSAGGGTIWGAPGLPGGAGGGLVHMQIAGVVHVDGLLTANGQAAWSWPGGNAARTGGGSGGGIYLTCDTLEGNGAIRALGGAPVVYGGGGGGGHIAIYRRVSNWSNTAEPIAAPASVSGGPITGTGTAAGTAGTVFIGTTATPGIEPQSIFGADLVAFYRTDSGIVRDTTGKVQSWNDRSMNGNHVAQSVSASRPGFVTSGMYPAVSFLDNPTQWLEALAVSGGPVANNHGLYMWAVRRETSGGIDTWHTYFGGRNTDAAGAFGMNTPERAVDQHIAVASPPSTLMAWAVAGAPAQLNDEWHYNEGYLNTASGLVAALDGNVITSVATPTTVVGGTLQRIDIGRNGPGSGNDFQGEIYEVGIARVNPSPDQLAAMRAYLDQRYIGELPVSAIVNPASGTMISPGTMLITPKVAAHYRSEIQRVELYAGASLVSTSTVAPYTLSWSATSGTYSLTARAYDTNGLFKTSAPITVIVNAPPSVTLTSPASGAVFFKPAGTNISIPVTATATDPDGTVQLVALYGDATLLSEDVSPPYTTNWTSATAGAHTVSAGAMDNLGRNGNTASVPITVWETTDIGSVGVTGGASNSGSTLSVTGAGGGIQSTADAFRFVYKQIDSTSFTVTARLASATGTATGARAGLMVRENLTAGSREASILYRPIAPTAVWFHGRATAGATTTSTSTAAAAPRWIRITRSGSSFTVFHSANGTSWTALGSAFTAAMGSSVYVGFATTSGTTASTSTATFDNITIP